MIEILPGDALEKIKLLKVELEMICLTRYK